jgi:bifunctional DNA-binding transcriptional regulator/antitoxin component of YhaV-PrlF toxin-antitoxin module
MRIRISKGGQISLPAPIRRRWETDSLVIEDLGDRVILRPIPTDPIGAAAGALGSGTMTSTQARERVRREEQAAEARKHRG